MSKVLALYNDGKTTREIAKELRMSLRDINTILKKHGVNHGIVTVEKDNKSSNNNEKATEAYRKQIEYKRWKIIRNNHGNSMSSYKLKKQSQTSDPYSIFIWKRRIKYQKVPGSKN